MYIYTYVYIYPPWRNEPMRLTPKGSKRGQPTLLTFATLDESPLRYALVYPGPHPCRPPPLAYIFPRSSSSPPPQRPSPSPSPSSWRKMRKRIRRRIKAHGSCRRCIITRGKYPGDVPNPCAMLGKNSLGYCIQGVIGWQGLYLSADGFREARTTPIKAQGLGRGD